MNKWIITGLIIIAVLVLAGVAYDQGLFDNMSGSGIAMLFAGLAAPYMAIKNWVTGDKFREHFRQKMVQMEEGEKVHRVDYDVKIQAKEKRIAELDKEIQLLDAKMEVLELKKKKVEQSVKLMSVDETRREAQNLFGD